MIENTQNQFRFSHVNKFTVNGAGLPRQGWWTWFIAYAIMHLGTISSVVTGILHNFRDRCSLSSSYSLTAAENGIQQMCALLERDISTEECTQAFLSAVIIMPEEAVYFRCSGGYSLSKIARVPAEKNSAACDNISRNVDLFLCLAVQLV